MKVEITYPQEPNILLKEELPFMVECTTTGSVFYVYKTDSMLNLYSICLFAEKYKHIEHNEGKGYVGSYRDCSLYNFFDGSLKLSN